MNNVNRLVFVRQTKCAFCAVGTEGSENDYREVAAHP
jgi:hypothetical protein